MLELIHARYVIVTYGGQGALLWNGKEWQHEPARSTHIVDRLGAGVIHGWLTLWRYVSGTGTQSIRGYSPDEST